VPMSTRIVHFTITVCRAGRHGARTDSRGSVLLRLRPRAGSAERQHSGLGDAGGGGAKVHHLQGSVPDAHRPGPGGAPRALSSSMGPT
jgi:hypothetical protein